MFIAAHLKILVTHSPYKSYDSSYSDFSSFERLQKMLSCQQRHDSLNLICAFHIHHYKPMNSFYKLSNSQTSSLFNHASNKILQNLQNLDHLNVFYFSNDLEIVVKVYQLFD